MSVKRIGSPVNRTTASGCCSARPFGTISPITMCASVSTRNRDRAGQCGAADEPQLSDVRLEQRRQRVLTVHAETEAGDRDAELGRGNVAILERRRREQPQHA